MAATIETSAPERALALQAEILARPITENRRMADVIRALAIDAVEAANSATLACLWAWPTLPPCCGRSFINSMPAHRIGRTATVSCCLPVTARCCCIRCFI